MIRHNKILVPTDFSEQSSESLRRAGVLAEKFDAEVHLLHVTDPSMYFETDMISAPPLEDLDDPKERELTQIQAQQNSRFFHEKYVLAQVCICSHLYTLEMVFWLDRSNPAHQCFYLLPAKYSPS